MSAPNQVRTFVVEDEAIVLLELTLLLDDLGYTVAGSASDLNAGLALAGEIDCDVAVIDCNLCGLDSTPIADTLAARSIPFVFLSGYTRSVLPERHSHRPLVSKPCSTTQLDAAIKLALPRAQAPTTSHQ